MIPTPNLSHLTRTDFTTVYEPAEDTFLLMDALEADQQELQSLKPRVCLEIGSGSGCVSSFLGNVLKPSSTLFLTTDINPIASSCTLRTGRQNKIPLDPIIANLADPLTSRLKHSIDLLIFNPPYVPTDESELMESKDRNILATWAGGRDGVQVTDILLNQLDYFLSPSGRFYLVALKQNDVPEIQRRLSEVLRLRSEVVLQRRAGREHLFVLKVRR